MGAALSSVVSSGFGAVIDLTLASSVHRVDRRLASSLDRGGHGDLTFRTHVGTTPVVVGLATYHLRTSDARTSLWGGVQVAVLEMHGRYGRGLDIRLVEDEYVIGTRPDACNIRVEDDDAVSRLHARIERHQGPTWSIIDTDSKNGTLVNASPLVGERTLRPGDEIHIGRHTKFVFRESVTQGRTTDLLDPPPPLTPRQRAVLIELVRPWYEQGPLVPPATTSTIADRLYVSDGAVKNQFGALYDKFGIFEPEPGGEPRRPQLARMVWQRGVIRPEDFKKPPE
jgi:hypothetical protein